MLQGLISNRALRIHRSKSLRGTVSLGTPPIWLLAAIKALFMVAYTYICMYICRHVALRFEVHIGALNLCETPIYRFINSRHQPPHILRRAKGSLRWRGHELLRQEAAGVLLFVADDRERVLQGLRPQEPA